MASTITGKILVFMRGSFTGLASQEFSNRRLRIAVDLSECDGGAQVWSERFDTPAEGLFEVQDEIVARIAATLMARLEETAVRQALRRPAGSLAAYELTLRGFAELRHGSFESDEAARALFQQAIEIDPFYARAYAGLSLSHFNEWTCQYWTLFRESGRLAYAYAHRALELDDRDAMLHLVVGRIKLYWRQFERALCQPGRIPSPISMRRTRSSTTTADAIRLDHLCGKSAPATRLLEDGDIIDLGDRHFEVIRRATPPAALRSGRW
jgi:hypothetical protein